MIAVRYAALLSLVVWVGGMVVLELLVAPSTSRLLPFAAGVAGHGLADADIAEIFRHFHLLTYVCGGVLLASFVVLKLVGPPPRAFIARIAIVVVMLAVALYSGLYAFSMALMTVNVALGLILVGWYARE
jgi:hypothetical protein